jgi:hypothetical protein
VTGSAGFMLYLPSPFSLKMPFQAKFGSFYQFTVAFWLKLNRITDPDRGNEIERIIIRKSGSYDQREYQISIIDSEIRHSRYLKVYMGHTNDDEAVEHNADPFSSVNPWKFVRMIQISDINEDWFHVLLAWNGSHVVMYVNLTLVKVNKFQSNMIQGYCNPLIIGKPFEFNSSLPHKVYGLNGYIESLAIWNEFILPDDPLQTPLDPQLEIGYQKLPPYNSKALVFFLSFDEGFGLYVPDSAQVNQNTNRYLSNFNNSIREDFDKYGKFEPLYDEVSMIHPNMLWLPSDITFNDVITTSENTPVVIVLNASDPWKMDISYQITSYPQFGALYYFNQYQIDYYSGQQLHPNLFPKINSGISSLKLNEIIETNQIIYVPSRDYNGDDMITYICHTSDSRSSERGTSIPIHVRDVTSYPDFLLMNPTIELKSFSIDADQRNKSIVDVELNIDSSSKTNDQFSSTVSLETTHGLTFGSIGKEYSGMICYAVTYCLE